MLTASGLKLASQGMPGNELTHSCTLHLCGDRNLEAIACVAEMDLSPRLLSNPPWAVACSKRLMDTIWCWTGHESYYILEATTSGQLGCLQSLDWTSGLDYWMYWTSGLDW